MYTSSSKDNSYFDLDEYLYDEEDGGEGKVDFTSLPNDVNLIDFTQGKNDKGGWIEFDFISHRGGPHQLCIQYQNLASRVPLIFKFNSGRVYKTQVVSNKNDNKHSSDDTHRISTLLHSAKLPYGYREPIIVDLRSAQKSVCVAFKAADGGKLNIKSFYFEVSKVNDGNYRHSIPFYSASFAPASFQRKTSLISYNEGVANPNKRDGWIIFEDVKIRGNRLKQKLWMRYASDDPRPMDIAINGKVIQNLTVTNLSTCGWNDEDLKWFAEPYEFDLTEYMSVATDRITVAFKARGNFPHLAAFIFREMKSIVVSERGHSKLRGVEQNRKTPFVFHFDIGNVGSTDERYVVAESFALTGRKPITFRSGWCNDAMTVGSQRLGTREGGVKLPAITFIDDDDRISEMKIGMSFFGGDDVAANFCAAIEYMKIKNLITGEVKDVDGLSAYLRTQDTPTWVYNREKLGLDLWITSAYYMKGVQGCKSRAIFRYGLALAASEEIPFSIEAFEEFWQWLVTIKYYHSNFEVVGRDDVPLLRLEKTAYEFSTELRDVEHRMRDLHDFLVSTFSGPNALTPSTGYLRGTKTHVSLTHDSFHIYVKLVPDIHYNEKIISTLFVDGKQYDPQGKSFANLESEPLDIQSYAILSILEDIEMLFEMGLLSSHDVVLAEDREILPLRHGQAFIGTYEMSRSACRAFHFLAIAGLRKVSIEEVFTSDEPWDIYNIAAGYSGVLNVPTITAITCMFVQTASPILLGVRAFYSQDDDGDELIFVVYITRIFFALYAVFYELKLQSDYSDETRLSSFLSMLPEFSPGRLLVGLFINLGAKLSLSVGIVILLWNSYTVIDVTLNSLALYFILDLDNYLVSLVNLDEYREKQKNALFEMKFVSSRHYYKNDQVENEIWTFEKWGFYKKLIQWTHNASFAAILCGACWIVVSPFFIGIKMTWF